MGGRTLPLAETAVAPPPSSSRPRLVWIGVSPASYQQVMVEDLRHDFHLSTYYYRPDPESPWVRSKDETYYQGNWRAQWRILQAAAAGRRRGRDQTLWLISGWQDGFRRLLIGVLSFHGCRFAIWTDTPRNDPGWRHRVRNAAVRLMGRSARALLGTGSMAENTLKAMTNGQVRVENFPYWVALPSPPRLPRSGSACLRVTCIGRLVSYKGFDLAIRALTELPDADIRLDILGSGPEQARLLELVAASNLQQRVRFCGAQDAAGIHAWLATRTDVLLHPAVRLEPYGVVILEAMAHAVPVIASELCGAAADRIVDGVNGWILPAPPRPEAIAQRLESLWRDPERAVEAGARARACAEKWPPRRASRLLMGVLCP